MRYFDTGSRDPEHTLAAWLERVLKDSVAEFRLQSGFFSAEAIGLLLQTLETAAKANSPAHVLVGSNDGATLHEDVVILAKAMGLPRSNGWLGVVSFSGAYFHPKTFHVRRKDGSQAALVGSGNLTPSGLALHVEAAVSLDTRDGDPPQELSKIAGAIDAWFNQKRLGLTIADSLETLDKLRAEGVLSVAPPPKSPSIGAGDSSSKSKKPRLKPLFSLPGVKGKPGVGADEADVGEEPAKPKASSAMEPVAVYAPSAPRGGFPPYLLFAPGAAAATSGVTALSGAQLPSGATGLIIRLNLDSGRHFEGRGGTANISIPVATLGVMRFGIYGIHKRPRAEYGLEFRFLGDKTQIKAGGDAKTNVMGYGFTEGESGMEMFACLSQPTLSRSGTR